MSGLATSVAEDFRMIIRVVRLQVIIVKYAYKDFCNQQSRGKGNSRFIGTQQEVGEEIEISVVDIVVIMLGQTM